MRPSAWQARAYAAKRGLPYLSLEDGFIRSFGVGEGFPPLSMVVDHSGIYYDASRPSDLEKLLNSDECLCQKDDQNARAAMEWIRDGSFSKYNHAASIGAKMFDTTRPGRKVLVVDQTSGDMSVSLGGADAKTFSDMLQAAMAENPDATVYVKTHPDVSSGRKRGYLTDVQSKERIVVLRESVNPLDLIAFMDKVYVVSSTMGFEALIVGKQVVCFGVPWYAGWGLTDDRCIQHPAMTRRRKQRTVTELFAAAYMRYTRYLDPVTGQEGDLFALLHWLAVQKEVQQHFQAGVIALSVRRSFHALAEIMFSAYSDEVLHLTEPVHPEGGLASRLEGIVICPLQELTENIRAFAKRHGYDLFSLDATHVDKRIRLRCETGSVTGFRYEWDPVLRGYSRWLYAVSSGN